MWLREDFVAPDRVDLPVNSHHLRKIRATDTELDMVAVMGSRERLWSLFGQAWGWPPATMTADQDRQDLQRHADEMDRNESFNYALFDREETALLGCVYIDPPERVGADAEVPWWVIDELVGSSLEQVLADFIPLWIEHEWPFENPRYVGRDLSWQDWMALPEVAL